MIDIQEYSLLLAITNACNLLCSDCSTLCDKNSSYFISKEDFIKQLKQINKIFPDCDTIDIAGGESLLHPDFIDLCEIAREICPNRDIAFWTNGIVLSRMSIKQLEFLTKELGIIFKTSIYPATINIFEKNKQNFEKINEELVVLGSRLYFHKQLLDKNGKQDIQKLYRDCYHFQKPYQFYIYKNRLYNCCISPYIVEKFNFINLDDFSLDIYAVNSKQEIFDFFDRPLSICSYCHNEQKRICEEAPPWNNLTNSERNVENTLYELYFLNYDEYKNTFHNKKTNNDIIQALKNEDYNKYLKDNGNHDNLIYHYKNRYRDGLIDIIIPFGKEIDSSSLKKLRTFYDLNTEDYINFHFISIDEDNEKNERILYLYFYPLKNDKISTWFYKAYNDEELLDIIFNLTYNPYMYIYSLNQENADNNIIIYKKYE